MSKRRPKLPLTAGIPPPKILRLGDPLPWEFDLQYDCKTVDDLVRYAIQGWDGYSGGRDAKRIGPLGRFIAEQGYDARRFWEDLPTMRRAIDDR